MTFGSAASLPGPVPGAPLPLFRSFSGPLGRGAPPRRSPALPAAKNPPRATILVVEDQAVVALDLQRTLRDAGYRVVGPASSPAEVERLIAAGRSMAPSIDGALVDVGRHGRTASAAADLLALSNIPFVFLASSRKDLPERHAGRPLVEKPYATDDLLAAVQQAVRERSVDEGIPYRVAPPRVSWPRVFPQL